MDQVLNRLIAVVVALISTLFPDGMGVTLPVGYVEPLPTAPVELATAGAGAPEVVDNRLFGVTIEKVDQIDVVVDRLLALDVDPEHLSTRVVFQEGLGPDHYEAAIAALAPVTRIVGLVLDSTAVAKVSVSQAHERAVAFMDAFAADVDIWEVGNELNGEWLGAADDILAKTDVVLAAALERGLTTMVTLNYWPARECHRYDWEDTLEFAQRLADRPLQLGDRTFAPVGELVDHVAVSFYEQACQYQVQPSVSDFVWLFDELASLFDAALLSFGELGDTRSRAESVERYYGTFGQLRDTIGHRFVGGGYWWYFTQDVVEAASWEVSLGPALSRAAREWVT